MFCGGESGDGDDHDSLSQGEVIRDQKSVRCNADKDKGETFKK